jgi:hypothetical protein
MEFPLFLAMTAAEIAGNASLPPKLAYLSCRFALDADGICGLPETLPEGSILMLSDETPISHHDPQLVARQLQEAVQRLACRYLVLDLQRCASTLGRQIVEAVAQRAGCCVVVSEAYAAGNELPVLVAPPPLWTPVQPYLERWKGRRLWLEAVCEAACVTVSQQGSRYEPGYYSAEAHSFTDRDLCISYSIKCGSDRVEFYLHRGRPQLEALLCKVEGLEGAIGLYQQLS